MNFFGDHPAWLIAFAIVGILATLTAIVSLFFALGRRPARMWAEEVAPVDSPDFMRPIAALLNTPIREGGKAELLNNGVEWLGAMLPDLRAAQKTIVFSAYIWEPGELEDMLVPILEERARAGVKVRVLLDGLGGMKIKDETVERLQRAGAKVDRFRPLSLGKLTRFHLRNHRRAIVIDGSIGYVGGMAVADHWLGDARNEKEWRDTMVRVTGPMVEHVQSAFTELWAYVCGEILTGEDFFPECYELKDTRVRSMGVVSSPAAEEHPLTLYFYLVFLAARERLWITTPYFVPDKHSRQAVCRRARAGVDVRILMPNEHTDAKPIRLTSHSYYQELLDAGVKVYEYQPTMIHTKHVVVDGKFSVVGSANMDIRSKELNEEAVLGILDEELAGRLEETFLRDLEQSRQINPAEWRRRNPLKRGVERIARLFGEQY